jgi:hypothetical protein
MNENNPMLPQHRLSFQTKGPNYYQKVITKVTNRQNAKRGVKRARL